MEIMNIDMIYRILIAKYKCKKIFDKLYKKLDLSNITLNMKIIDDEFIQFDQCAKYALGKQNGLAGTYINFMISDKDNPNDIYTEIKHIDFILYIPESTIKAIAYKCKFRPWDMNFCIWYILRHEFGHILDFSKYNGQSLIDVKKYLNKVNKELDYLKLSLYNDNFITLENWKVINKTSIEGKANKIAKISDKEMKRFYKIMNRRIIL